MYCVQTVAFLHFLMYNGKRLLSRGKQHEKKTNHDHAPGAGFGFSGSLRTGQQVPRGSHDHPGGDRSPASDRRTDTLSGSNLCTDTRAHYDANTGADARADPCTYAVSHAVFHSFAHSV
jgi:hypothetical protein